MRGVMIHAPGDIRVEDRPDPVIEDPTDASFEWRPPAFAVLICGLTAATAISPNLHPWGMSTWAWSKKSVPTSRT